MGLEARTWASKLGFGPEDFGAAAQREVKRESDIDLCLHYLDEREALLVHSLSAILGIRRFLLLLVKRPYEFLVVD